MPEIVFIADRSGSMTDRVAPLKSSLSVFLRSLPLGVHFNICSFGSAHTFLWDQSRPYTNETLEEAQQHVDEMEATYGGTVILPPIQSAITRRRGGPHMLEIMVLTDGQVWDAQTLLQFVERQTSHGDVRIFSLGIGRDVSHSLVDGLARAGRGFSQVIVDEREGMESKVARMLRGGLSPHVMDYRLEWEGQPRDEVVDDHRVGCDDGPALINLFDTTADTDPPMSFLRPPDSFVPPSVLQAPYKLPPLFPFSRVSVGVLLSHNAPAPSRVWLRGNVPGGPQLELEIAVQSVAGVYGETIHQLAARKVLQELEEGVGYMHSRGYGSREEWVKREGVRVGLRYGVASKWTSFLAEQREEEEAVVVRREEGEVETGDVAGSSQSQDTDDDDTYDFANDGYSTMPAGGGGYMNTEGGYMGSVPTMMAVFPPPPSIDYPKKWKFDSYGTGKDADSELSGKDGGEMASSDASPLPDAQGGSAKFFTAPALLKKPDQREYPVISNPAWYSPPPPPVQEDTMPTTGSDKQPVAYSKPLLYVVICITDCFSSCLPFFSAPTV
jgi:hypothetical protein